MKWYFQKAVSDPRFRKMMIQSLAKELGVNPKIVAKHPMRYFAKFYRKAIREFPPDLQEFARETGSRKAYNLILRLRKSKGGREFLRDVTGAVMAAALPLDWHNMK